MVFSTKHKPLMEKFNLSVDFLDYKYIENCRNVKQLERILRVLRSGEEGIFPHLTKFCEEKLRTLDPDSRLLVIAENVKRYSELPEPQRKEIETDLEDWSYQLSKYRIQNNSTEKKESANLKELPPIRKGNILKDRKENKRSETSDADKVQSKKCQPRTYDEWNKYNVDEELNKLDNEEIDNDKTKDIETTDVSELSKSVSVTDLTKLEREKLANTERIKGNEAYTAQDYEEAIIYYTRSLSAYKTAKSLNNRAQAYIKLKRYLDAVLDCNEAIDMEPNNVKALYRRGIAHKEAEMYDLAILDFAILLEIEPENTTAKEQLQQVENLKFQGSCGKKTVIIEELKTEEMNPEEFQKDENTISSRIFIEEATDTTCPPLLDEICNCNGDVIESLSKDTQEMLSIVPSYNLGQLKPASNANSKNKENNRPNTNGKTKYDFTLSQSKVSRTNRKLNISKTTINDNKVETIIPITNNHTQTKVKNNFHQKERIDLTSTRKKTQNDCSIKLKDTATKMEKEHITKIEAISKDSNLRSQGEYKTQTIPTQNKITPFEFVQSWLSNNANNNSFIGATYLLKIKPNQLPKLLTNKLDAPLLYGMLMAINNLIETGKVDESMEFLNNLIKVPRIKMVSLLLSDEEKKNINTMLVLMEKKHNSYVSKVREVLTVKAEVLELNG